MLRRLKFISGLGVMLLMALMVSAEQRFPPPDFENGYRLPTASTPAARHSWLQYVDAGVFLAALGVAVWLIYKKRSRRGLFWLSLFSLAYFGFYRKGCICPIGSPQNVIYGLFNPDYAVPVTVLIFCFAPIVVALFAGRAFCAGVCPQGALQDFMLIKPVTVPLWLEQALSVVPYIFLGAGLIYAGTGTGFVICRYDPVRSVLSIVGRPVYFDCRRGLSVGRDVCGPALLPVSLSLRRFVEAGVAGLQMARPRHARCLHAMPPLRTVLSLRRDARAFASRVQSQMAWPGSKTPWLAAGTAAGARGRRSVGRFQTQPGGGAA